MHAQWMIMEAGLTTLRIMQQAGRNRLVVLGHQGLHAEDNDTRFELVGKYRLGRLVDVAHVMNRDQDQDGEPERHSMACQSRRVPIFIRLSMKPFPDQLAADASSINSMSALVIKRSISVTIIIRCSTVARPRM
jgi:hypothetical protein